jgi:hypothetical protein
MTWVDQQGFLTASANSDMATSTWVGQTYLGKTDTAVAATKLATARTLWGQSFDGQANVTGDMSSVGHITAISNGTKDIIGFRSIEMYGPNSGYIHGGYIDFHYALSGSDYTSRIIEDASGRISFICDEGIRIGGAVLKWDSTNNALKLHNQTGENDAVNFYAMGAISALGKNGGSGGGGEANESRSYTMPESGDANKWHRLGNYTMNSDGQVVCIDIFTGNGYNGQPYQNSWARIMLKRSANTSGTASVVSVTCEQFGRSLGDGKILVRVNATAYNAGQVWVKCPWANPLGAYTVQGNYSSWLHNASVNDDTTNPSYNQTTGYYDSTGSMSTTE